MARAKKARLISSKKVYRGPVFEVTTDHIVEPSGIRVRRDVVRHPGSVIIAALDGRGQILLERQYRHPAQDSLWELPAGSIDPGESALAAAQRELLEETGYTASSWKRLFTFYASPGFLDETHTVYLATGLRAGRAQPDDDEAIALRFFSLPAAVRMIPSGRLRDGKTLAAVLWLDRARPRRRPGIPLF